MKPSHRSVIVTLLGLGTLGLGCSVAPGSAPASTDDSVVAPEPLVPEITGGKPVDPSADPITLLFLLSTVHIHTMTNDGMCTGTILSPTQILTAAHCQPDDTTQVFLYGASTDARPTLQLKGTGPFFSPVAKVTYPPGSDTDPLGYHPLYADMAIITLTDPLPDALAWQTAVPPAANSFLANRPRPPWAVGTGDINGAPQGDLIHPIMSWKPSPIRGGNDDTDGAFETQSSVTDQGDSGGPLYQWLPAPTTNAAACRGGLRLMGVLSGSNKILFGAIGLSDQYTSTDAAGVNNYWLLKELATSFPAPGVFRVSTGAQAVLNCNSTSASNDARWLQGDELEIGSTLAHGPELGPWTHVDSARADYAP